MSEFLWVLRRVLEPELGVPQITEGGMGGFFTAQMVEEKWEYRDFPRMGADTWLLISNKIEGHYKAMTWARYPDGQVRGQVVVSPAGIKIMRDLCAS